MKRWMAPLGLEQSKCYRNDKQDKRHRQEDKHPDKHEILCENMAPTTLHAALTDY